MLGAVDPVVQFPSRNNSNYLKTTVTVPLTAVTVSWWMKTTLNDITLFSYANGESVDAFGVFISQASKIRCVINAGNG